MSETDDSSESDVSVTYEGGFEAVVERMQARQDPLSFAKSEALPPVDVDFAPLKTALVTEISESDMPRAKDVSGHGRKSLELNAEFIGMPELCKLHGLLIAHLRKSNQPEHTMALFTRLWAEEAEFLFSHLDPRWLVSAITTFGDHGQNEVQRRVGQSMTVLFAAMKLYESERLYSGFTPDSAFKLKRLVHRKLPLNMDRYALVSGGLDINMLGRLWVDAKEDHVIAPLAHQLLNLLNADPGTVFRRFTTLRGRKIRQRAQKLASVDDPEPEPAHSAARVKTNTWGTVSTVKAPVEQIERFIAHHLALGATRMTIFLDEPLSKTALAQLSDPRVSLINCDAGYWAATGKPLMAKHQQRQAFNATRAYREARTDWLAHIDCDEFLYSDISISQVLLNASDKLDALMMPPAEEVAQVAPKNDLLFRRTYFDAACDKAVLADLYPTFGDYLRSGFISHTAGKTIARTGLTDVRFGVHLLKRNGIEVKNVERTQDLNVLHRHAPDWASFEAHLEFRLSKGSYRDRGQSRLGLGDIIDVLREEHGDTGPRQLFDEVCVANPETLKILEDNAMLIRTRLKREAKDE